MQQRAVPRGAGVQVDPSETTTLKGMYFQLVDNQVLSTQGQPDVNLHRLTSLLTDVVHGFVLALSGV